MATKKKPTRSEAIKAGWARKRAAQNQEFMKRKKALHTCWTALIDLNDEGRSQVIHGLKELQRIFK